MTTSSTSGPTRPGDQLGRAAADATKDIGAEARRLGAEATRAARDVAESRKGMAADYANAIAAALDGGAAELAGQGYERSATFASGAAREIGALATRVADGEPEDIARDVERFARDRPGLFFGLSLLAGLAATRFIVSSRAGAAAPHGQTPAGGDRS